MGNWALTAILQSIATALFFPPFGGVLMFISCDRLEATDYVLGFIIPIFGLVKFWTC